MLILVTARNGSYYVVERQPAPPSGTPRSFMIPMSSVQVAEVNRRHARRIAHQHRIARLVAIVEVRDRNPRARRPQQPALRDAPDRETFLDGTQRPRRITGRAQRAPDLRLRVFG